VAVEDSKSARRTWSLSGRLRLWFAATSVALVATIGLASDWWLRRGALDQLAALAEEELDEFRVLFETGERSAGEAARILETLSAEHLDVTFGLRLALPAGYEPIDPERLFAGLPAGATPPPEDRSRHLGGGRVWSSELLDDGTRVELLLDGDAVLDRARGFERALVGMLAVAALLGLCVAEFASRRIGALLREVAESVRAHRGAEGDVRLASEDPPAELRQVVEALGELLASIRAESARTRLLTAGMAHELRAPIQNLLGETEVALMAERSGEQYRETLRDQLALLHELADAIDNLVSLCRDGEARQPQLRERFDLGAETEMRQRRWRLAAEHAGVELRVALSGPLEIEGDREALLRALRNLVANGIAASPDGAAVELTLRGGGGSIEVLVEDRGPGIAPADRARVFEPFFRGPTTRGRRAGYGLGLALVRSAVDAQGGSVSIESREGGGTRFRLHLSRHGPRQGPGSAAGAA
jgi:signal transduction histidine kinase